MTVFRDIDNVENLPKNAVVALGNFDGFHLGHRAIIARAKAIADEQKRPLALMSFEPHPREILAKDTPPFRIFSLRSKLETAKTLGIEYVFLLHFNAAFANLSAQEFITTILHQKLSASHIITGDNFYFGKGRGGDTKLLSDVLPALGISYTAHPHVNDAQGAPISSSAVRKLLAQGNVKAASNLLGQPYHISGHVVHGFTRGKQLGFPTANVRLGKLFVAKHGVYAVRATIEGDDKIYTGVANLGIKPTLGNHAPLLEVHLFDTNHDFYGKRLHTQLIEFIRPEEKFASLDALKKQIAHDAEKAKTLL